MRFFNRKALALAGAAAALVALGSTGTAVAGSLIGSADIQDGSIRSVDIMNGKVKIHDLSPKAVAKLQGQDGKNGINGKDGVNGKDADMSVVQALQARVAALETNAGNGSDVNINWANGLGATIVDANTVVLDSRNAQGYAVASIPNLDLPVSKSTVIEFTYKLDNGAAIGWGAPRIQIRINGVTYSSAHQINPDYGHDNGDGTFTVQAVATSMNDNSATANPEGTITRASLVYDYQAKGTVTFTNVVIGGQPISFQ
jgi:hypothetical protein